MSLITNAQFLCTRVHQFPLSGAILSQGWLSPSLHKELRGTPGGGHPDLGLNPSIASCPEDAHSVTSLSLGCLIVNWPEQDFYVFFQNQASLSLGDLWWIRHRLSPQGTQRLAAQSMWCIENYKSAGMWAPRRGGDGWGNQAGLPKEGGSELNLKEERTLPDPCIFLIGFEIHLVCPECLAQRCSLRCWSTDLPQLHQRNLFCWDSKINSSLSSSGPLCLCSLSVKCPFCEAPSYPLQFGSGKIFFGRFLLTPLTHLVDIVWMNEGMNQGVTCGPLELCIFRQSGTCHACVQHPFYTVG